MKELLTAVVAAVWSITSLDARDGSYLQVSSARAFENDSSFSFTISRAGPSNVVQRVQFGTEDGTALAGRDYVAVSGTLTLHSGEMGANITVPLIDNTLPDGERFFYLRLGNPEPCADIWPHGPSCDPQTGGPPPLVGGCQDGERGMILDDEFPLTRVDPSFVPDYHSSDVPGVVLGGGVPGHFGWIATLSDGKILASFSPPLEYPGRLVRLLASGALDPAFQAQPLGAELRGVLKGGKLLIGEPSADGTGEILRRINTDGGVDQTFMPHRLGGNAVTVLEQSTGRILVHAFFTQYDKPIPGGGYYAIGGLIRLNMDGSVDATFAPDLGEVGEVFQRKDGRLIVKVRNREEPWRILQITEDGARDPGFGIQLDPGHTPLTGWVEQADGRLLIPVVHSIRRLNPDGSPDLTFAPAFHEVCSQSGLPPPTITIADNGDILFRAHFASVDGFPRRGFVRLRNADPVPEFMVLTPAESYRSGTARIRVIRTGTTEKAARVDYSTADGTAIQDREYRPIAGTLEFAAGEASRIVEIPLVTNAGAPSERLSFNLLLSSPSAGYRAIAASAVTLLPDVRVMPGDYLAGRSVRVEGVLPESEYSLETSSDLKSWHPPGGYLASRNGTSILFKDIQFLSESDMRFFRVRRH